MELACLLSQDPAGWASTPQSSMLIGTQSSPKSQKTPMPLWTLALLSAAGEKGRKGGLKTPGHGEHLRQEGTCGQRFIPSVASGIRPKVED